MKQFVGLVAMIASFAASPSLAAPVFYTFSSAQGPRSFSYQNDGFVSSYRFLDRGAVSGADSDLDSVEFCFAGEQCGRPAGRSFFSFTATTDTIYVISGSRSSVPLPTSIDLPPGVTPAARSVGQTFEFAVGTFDRFASSSSNRGFGTGNLAVTSEPIGAVPEPSIWAMMILGLGMVGSSMRRRKRQAAVRFA